MRSKIKLTRSDALALLRFGLPKWPRKTLIYLDPPYYERGRELYYDYYKQGDHEELAKFIAAKMRSKFWIVSYDNVSPIKRLYSDFRSVIYSVGYSAREMRTGKEVMFFSPALDTPDLVGPVRQIGKIREVA
jgi:DNA adenine methylase